MIILLEKDYYIFDCLYFLIGKVVGKAIIYLDNKNNFEFVG